MIELGLIQFPMCERGSGISFKMGDRVKYIYFVMIFSFFFSGGCCCCLRRIIFHRRFLGLSLPVVKLISSPFADGNAINYLANYIVLWIQWMKQKTNNSYKLSLSIYAVSPIFSFRFVVLREAKRTFQWIELKATINEHWDVCTNFVLATNGIYPLTGLKICWQYKFVHTHTHTDRHMDLVWIRMYGSIGR